jgi:hypothetical protein
MMSAIAMPALLGQRSRARDKSAISNLDSGVADLIGQWDKAREDKEPLETIKPKLEAYLKRVHENDRNPWNTSLPAYSYTIAVARGNDRSQAEETAKAASTEVGQSVFSMVLPSGQKLGYITGAVQIKSTINGTKFYTKTVEIE